MNDTLILNADGQPLSVLPLSTLSWQDSVKLIWLDRVDVVYEYANRVVRSPSMKIQVPSVIMLQDYVNREKEIKFSRYNILLRDLFTCLYCANEFPAHVLTLDHVKPRYKNGKTRWENVVAACERCNLTKANKEDMTPQIQPYKPTYKEMARKRKKFPITIPDRNWAEFLDWDDDKIILP